MHACRFARPAVAVLAVLVASLGARCIGLAQGSAVTLTKAALDVSVIVRDADEALRFYRDVLGLSYRGDPQSAPGSTGWIYRAALPASPVATTAPSPTAAGGASPPPSPAAGGTMPTSIPPVTCLAPDRGLSQPAGRSRHRGGVRIPGAGGRTANTVMGGGPGR